MSTELQSLAEHLVAAWNGHDLEEILAHYSDDFELTTPLVRRILGVADGTLRGKEAVRGWWRRVLDRRPDLRIDLVSMSPGVASACMVQRISALSTLGVSVFELDAEGRIRREVFHGE